MEEEDRISELPDPILQKILSFLVLNQAIETSVLSKRWRNLWLTLPILDFNFVKFYYWTGRKMVHANKTCSMGCFTRFVTEVLSRRDLKSPVTTLRLRTSEFDRIDPSIVKECLDYAIKRSVQILDLSVNCNTSPFFHPLRELTLFPGGHFASATLRELRLRSPRDFVLPEKKSLVLPNLKVLHLEKFSRLYNSKLGHFHTLPKEFLSGFPNLEELTLCRCEVDGLIISAPKLRILVLMGLDPPPDRHESHMEEISAPALTSLRYEGCCTLVCQKLDCPHLEELYFEMLTASTTTPANLIGMLLRFGHYAKFVTFTLYTTKILAEQPELLEQSPAPFPNLKHLKFANDFNGVDTVPHTVVNYLTKRDSPEGE